MKAKWACAAAMGLAFVLYVGAVGAGFAWDDELLFRSWLPYLDSPRAILSPPAEIPNFTFQYFRPLVLTSYVADEWLASHLFAESARDQGRRIVFHLTPIVLHVACTGLVFLLGLRLARRVSEARERVVATAFAGSLLFAAHPIHVESVAWIAGRSDPLCALFAIGALLAFIDWRERRRARSLMLACAMTLLGMLAKESAAGIVLPGVVVALAWPACEPSRSRSGSGRVREFAGVATTLGTYAVMRVAFGADGGSMARVADAATAARHVASSAGWYLARSAWPFPQTVFPPQQLASYYVGLGLVALALVMLGLFGWRRPRHAPERVALALALGGLLAPLAVAATTLATSPVAERHLYLSSAGACVLAALVAARLFERRTPASATRIPEIVLVAALVAVPWSVVTSQRVRVWDDPLLFWQSAAGSAPTSPVAWINLGQAMTLAGRLDDAERAYRTATELDGAADQTAMARANLGALHLRRDRLDLAIAEFGRALESNPRDASALFNLASALERTARAEPDPARRAALVDVATERLRQALSVHPRYGKARLMLGSILLDRGQTDEARELLRSVVEIAPGTEEARRAGELLSGFDDDAGARGFR